MDGIIMSKKELNIYRHAMNVIEGRLSITEFSMMINKSYRQSQRIIKKVREKGPLGATHGNCGRVPINKTPEEKIKEAIDLLEDDYNDFNLTHFKEMLEENEDIKINYSTLYRAARKKNLIKQQKRRSSKVHKPRPRLPREGMLIQFDGSEHKWFGNITCDLIAGIDDATGKIMDAGFYIGETSLHSMNVIQNINEHHGIPEAFYMDEAGIFGKRERDWNSQIARAFETLDIKLTLASSPQAKGRVERLFRTLQDRLIAELNFVQVKNIIEANDYLKNTFIPNFNRQFSHKARESHKSFIPAKNINLDNILCRKIKKKVASGNTFSYQNEKYLITENKDYRFRSIFINTHQDGTFTHDIMGKKVTVERLAKEDDKILEVA
jgi:transposase